MKRYLYFNQDCVKKKYSGFQKLKNQFLTNNFLKMLLRPCTIVFQTLQSKCSYFDDFFIESVPIEAPKHVPLPKFSGTAISKTVKFSFRLLINFKTSPNRTETIVRFWESPKTIPEFSSTFGLELKKKIRFLTLVCSNQLSLYHHASFFPA